MLGMLPQTLNRNMYVESKHVKCDFLMYIVSSHHIY
jgi:hypothetical protein